MMALRSLLAASAFAVFVTACGGSQPSSSASTPSPTPTPTPTPTAPALKDVSGVLPATVAGLTKCSAQPNLSGASLQAPIPGLPTAAATAAPADISQFAAQGVNGAYSEVFGSEGFCPGQAAANPSAALSGKLVSMMVVSFMDPAHAQTAWSSNFLNVKDAAAKAGGSAGAQPVSGLGANFAGGVTTLPTGSAIFVAVWQNGPYLAAVVSYGLTAADAQALAGQVNSKMA